MKELMPTCGRITWMNKWLPVEEWNEMNEWLPVEEWNEWMTTCERIKWKDE